jgi:hypothetical protein
MLELSVNAKSKAAVILNRLMLELVFDFPSVEANNMRVWSIASPNKPSLQVSGVWLHFDRTLATRLLTLWDTAWVVVTPPTVDPSRYPS